MEKKGEGKLEQISLKDPVAYGRIHDETKALVRVHKCDVLAFEAFLSFLLCFSKDRIVSRVIIFRTTIRR